jgi:sialate O-acetylesterase
MNAKSIYSPPFKVVVTCLLLSLFSIATAYAMVTPAACFTDNMVLQQKTPATLWGTADAGKHFSIVTSWNNKTYSAVADAGGSWKIKVNTPVYGGPYTITFDDGEPLVLKNILIGEVWICSGQSNMEMQVSGPYGDVLNVQQELATAANYPNIRMLKIDTKTSFKPQTNIPVKWGWNICNSQTVRDFSAVAYFFAKNLYDDKHIPIGIINSTWGGTVAATR